MAKNESSKNACTEWNGAATQIWNGATKQEYSGMVLQPRYGVVQPRNNKATEQEHGGMECCSQELRVTTQWYGATRMNRSTE